jgi:hypothetical protein
MEPNQIARATQVAARGEIVVPRTILEYLVTDEEPADLDSLTTRQREILELVARGYSNARDTATPRSTKTCSSPNPQSNNTCAQPTKYSASATAKRPQD